MDTTVKRARLETLLNEWVPRITDLVADLEEIGMRVDLSVSVHVGDESMVPRGEIIIRISPVEA